MGVVGSALFEGIVIWKAEKHLKKIMPSKVGKAKGASKMEKDPSPVLSQPDSPRPPKSGDQPLLEKKGRGRPPRLPGSVVKKKKKPQDRQYKRYVGIVLRQVHPGMTMSSEANKIMNSFLQDCFERIADEAGRLGHHPESKRKHSRIEAREVQTACRLLLPGELSKHAISEGTKAVTKYFSK